MIKITVFIKICFLGLIFLKIISYFFNGFLILRIAENQD